MKRPFILVVAMLAAVLMVPAGTSQADLDCVIEENVEPHLICIKVERQLFGSFGADPSADPDGALYLGVVQIEPLGLGPYPAAGVGLTSPCDRYAPSTNCQEIGNPVPVVPREVGVDGVTCLDRHDVLFRPTTDAMWTTVGFALLAGSCPAEQ